jgi:hypothetical protein
MQTMYENREDLLIHAWHECGEALKDRGHLFRTFALATIRDGQPEIRTVVLRRVNAERWTLGFNADVRSPKVGEIQTEPRVSGLFYSQPHGFQIRFRGTAVAHHQDDVAQDAWDKTPLLGRRVYLSPAGPSERSDIYQSNIPPELIDREPNEEESVAGYANFVAVEIQVETMDILSLAFDGNRRAEFTRESSVWLLP